MDRLLGVIFGILSHISRAYRWLFMIEPLGYKPRFANSLMAVILHILLIITIPRAGEVARASIITNYEGIPFEKGFGTIVAERMLTAIMLLMIITVTLFLEFEFIFNFFAEKFNLITLIIAGVSGLLLMLLFFVFIKKSQFKICLKSQRFYFRIN